jgi:hypothetical protein
MQKKPKTILKKNDLLLNSMAKKRKEWKFKMRIFLWYVVTEPARQLWKLIEQLFVVPARGVGKWVTNQNNNLIWAYIASILLGISLAVNDKIIAAMTFAIILFIILTVEYHRGYFMHRYREEYKKRIQKKAKKIDEKIKHL